MPPLTIFSGLIRLMQSRIRPPSHNRHMLEHGLLPRVPGREGRYNTTREGESLISIIYFILATAMFFLQDTYFKVGGVLISALKTPVRSQFCFLRC